MACTGQHWGLGTCDPAAVVGACCPAGAGLEPAEPVNHPRVFWVLVVGGLVECNDLFTLIHMELICCFSPTTRSRFRCQ